MTYAMSRLELPHLCESSTHTTLLHNTKMARPGTATRPMYIRMLQPPSSSPATYNTPGCSTAASLEIKLPTSPLIMPAQHYELSAVGSFANSKLIPSYYLRLRPLLDFQEGILASAVKSTKRHRFVGQGLSTQHCSPSALPRCNLPQHGYSATRWFCYPPCKSAPSYATRSTPILRPELSEPSSQFRYCLPSGAPFLPQVSQCSQHSFLPAKRAIQTACP
jgi:hypothetical protein